MEKIYLVSECEHGLHDMQAIGFGTCKTTDVIFKAAFKNKIDAITVIAKTIKNKYDNSKNPDAFSHLVRDAKNVDDIVNYITSGTLCFDMIILYEQTQFMDYFFRLEEINFMN